jgi:hypothetical protein
MEQACQILDGVALDEPSHQEPITHCERCRHTGRWPSHVIKSRPDHDRPHTGRRILVSVLVSFTPIRPGSAATQPGTPPQVRTGANLDGRRSGELESVLGATPHEFESRILRLIEGPDRCEAVRAFVVSWSQFWSQSHFWAMRALTIGHGTTAAACSARVVDRGQAAGGQGRQKVVLGHDRRHVGSVRRRLRNAAGGAQPRSVA